MSKQFLCLQYTLRMTTKTSFEEKNESFCISFYRWTFFCDSSVLTKEVEPRATFAPLVFVSHFYFFSPLG